mgnify:CR=1 FL=1
MVALATLSDINNNLAMTNNRVSTGLRIADASDSAAYWAIATTTSSDNGALGTVQDALAIGKATFEVMYNGLESVRDNLQDMKQLLVAARQPGVDLQNIQTQIDGLQTDMTNKAGASVINEQNFLAVDTSAAGFNATKSIVASFERSATAVTVSTIEFDISDAVLTDAHGTAASKTGILDQQRGVAAAGAIAADAAANVLSVDISGLTTSAGSQTRIDQFIALVDEALTETISAQNEVGVTLARAESQESFISALMDANDRAVGALVDANMEEESTKLRALQTQQQLAVQSLAIANSSAQNVLALFG